MKEKGITSVEACFNLFEKSAVVTTVEVAIVPVFSALIATVIAISPAAVVTLIQLAIYFFVSANTLTIFSCLFFSFICSYSSDD